VSKSKLVNVTGPVIKKCVIDITDYLYAESEGFNEWYMSLTPKEEEDMDNKLFDILNSRINKMNN